MPDVDLLLDTDIMVDLLRKYAPAVRWAGQNSSLRLGIPALVRLEIIQGTRNQQELDAITRELNTYVTLHLESQDSIQAMEWFEQYHLSNGIGILDCLIAATAWRVGKPLCTFNTRHYAVISGLHSLAPYSRRTAT